MNKMLKRPREIKIGRWIPEWLDKAWDWVDPGPKYILVLIIWTIIWLWFILWLGNIEYCPGREHSFSNCEHDWINWACAWTGILLWFGGAWGMMIQWENRGEE